MTIVVQSAAAPPGYTWLKQAVADLIHRSDLDGKIPDFIRFAELTINRRLNLFPKEVEVPLTMTQSSRYVPLPTDYGSPVALWLTTNNPREELVMTVAEQLPVDDAVSAKPRFWAIDGARIAFGNPADAAYTLAFRYVQEVFLSDLAPTNAVFERARDLYLYGAAAHSALFTRDDPQLPVWKAEFNRILGEVAAELSRSKGMANLRTDIVEILPSSYGYNHRQGYYR